MLEDYVVTFHNDITAACYGCTRDKELIGHGIKAHKDGYMVFGEEGIHQIQ